MKKIITMLLAASCFSTLLPMNFALAEENIMIYVSLNGSDENDGSFEKPLKTLKAARNKVREINNGDKDITVNFMGGTYELTETVEFSKEDSGSDGEHITYKAYNDEEVKFIGYKTLSTNGFKAVTDLETLNRLPKEAQGKVGMLDLKRYKLDIPETTITTRVASYYAPPYPWFYVNDKEQVLAKYPNNDYATIEEPIKSGEPDPIVFKFNDERIKRWGTADEAFLDGYFKYTYAYEQTRVIIDTAAKTLTTPERLSYGQAKGGRWRINNLLEEIDMPGEYFLDRKNEILYYYPAYTLKDAELKLVLYDGDFANLNNVSNISFEGLSFEKTLGNVFVINDSSNINIKNCEFDEVGRIAIYGENITESIVDGCDFSYIGSSCVRFSGGDRQTLIPADNKITNNIMYKYAEENLGGGRAIYISGVGMTVEHNVICDGPLGAIHYNGNDHLIRYNEIFDVNKESMDVGAIYSGRDYAGRGNEIAYNYLHDIRSNMEGNNCVGIYLDDQLSENYIHHNIITNTVLGVLVGGGRDIVLKENIIANCNQAIIYDNRGEGWQAAASAPGGVVYESLNKVPATGPLYLEKYPKLEGIFENKLGVPVGANVSGNILYNNQSKSSFAKTMIENAEFYEAPVELTDTSDFVDAPNGDFRIKEDSPLLEKYPDLAKADSEKTGTNKDMSDFEIKDFKLIYPKNGTFNIDNTEHLFTWDAAIGANQYVLHIAEDPEMKNIVYEDTAIDNYLIVSGLETGLKKLYWRVIAQNTSRVWPCEKASKGAPYLLQTSKYDVTDRTRLQEIISIIEPGVEKIVEGTGKGEFVEGTKQVVAEALNKAKAVNENLRTSQKEIDKVIKELEDTMNGLNLRANLYFTGIDNMLTSQSDWEGSNLVLESGKSATRLGGNSGTVSYKKEFIPQKEAMSMKMKLDKWGNWITFAVKQSETNKMPYSQKKSYFIVCKTSVIEFQKPGKYLAEIPNDYVEEGAWHNIDVGAIDCGIGVRVIYRVDGETVVDCFDWENPVSEPGYFTLAAADSSQEESIMPADVIPEPIMGTGDAGSITLEEVNFDEVITGTENTVIKETAGNASLNFRVNFADLSETKAITFRQGDVSPFEGGTAYGFTVNNGVIALMKYKDSKREYLAIADNNLIDAGKEHNVVIENYRSDGGVTIVLKIDGKTLFEYEDEAGIFTKGSVGAYSVK